VKVDAVPFYFQELEVQAGQALALLDAIQVNAKAWFRARTAKVTSVQADDRRLLAANKAKTNVYWDLDHFLAIWSRVSLLVAPAPRGKGLHAAAAKERGRCLRCLLGLRANDPITRRQVRDSWMHFDERMDRALAAGSFGVAQAFCRSSDVKARRSTTLRLLNLETLTLHVRSVNDSFVTVRLTSMRKSLEGLLARLPAAKKERDRRLVLGIGCP
jgi:hypothetical protein